MTPEEKKQRIESLRNRIENFGRKELSADPRCLADREELDRLQSGGLSFATSLATIREAAASGRFVAYGTIAEASGLPWNKARHLINKHLDELCKWASDKGFPLITAVVVEKGDLKTGTLGDGPLSGFISAAERCGVTVPQDHRTFLCEQQLATFRWASLEETA